MQYRARRRAGLTLVEMVLTFAIGMLILMAVFMVMRSQYLHTQAGRDAIEESTVARAVLSRVGSDVLGSLGPVDPRFLPVTILPNNANQGVPATPASTSGTTSTSTTATGATSTTTMSANSAKSANSASSSSNSNSNSSSSSSSNSSSSSSSSSSGTTQLTLPYNLGIKGDAKWLVISSSRVPGALTTGKGPLPANPTIISADLRSVSLWLADGGLARNEMTAVTSDDAPTGEPSFANPQQYVFAPQVQDVLFEYFDGQTWQTSWDGGELGGSDGNTPIGPPAAIAITISLRSGPANEGGVARSRKYKHVIAIPATNAFTLAAQSGQSQQMSGLTLSVALQAGTLVPPNANQQTSQSSQPGGQSSNQSSPSTSP